MITNDNTTFVISAIDTSSMLDEIRQINTKLKELVDRKHELIQEAKKCGMKWQEMSHVCKLSAVIMYKQEHGCDLLCAKETVEDFLNQGKK